MWLNPKLWFRFELIVKLLKCIKLLPLTESKYDPYERSSLYYTAGGKARDVSDGILTNEPHSLGGKCHLRKNWHKLSG